MARRRRASSCAMWFICCAVSPAGVDAVPPFVAVPVKRLLGSFEQTTLPLRSEFIIKVNVFA